MELVKQNENIKELLRLVKENPALKIVPMVSFNVVGDGDDGSIWMANWGEARKDQYCLKNDNIYFKSVDTEELIDLEVEESYVSRNDDIDDDEAKVIVEAYDWIPCITIDIDRA